MLLLRHDQVLGAEWLPRSLRWAGVIGQSVPSHHRIRIRFSGSAYHPSGGEELTTTVFLPVLGRARPATG